MGSLPEQSRCWVTLLTKSSYLPGVIILAHSLEKHCSKYPLIVQYTSGLGEESLQALQEEAQRNNRIVLDPVDLLIPRKGQENVGSVAERFKDTFTKLRAFELYKHGFERVCFLDADMMVMQNPDDVFEHDLEPDWLGANHACVCNLDKDSWAPSTWNKGNCAYTALEHPDDVAHDITSRPTYHLLNGGLFIFDASEKLWARLLGHFNTTDNLKNYQFPDQDFLADFYEGKWQPVSWRYNALKTMRYWHPRIWDDDKLAILHYIVDKPWERQISSDGIAGHLGRDGMTHSWWWKVYREWYAQQPEDSLTLALMNRLVDTEEPFEKYIPLPQEPGTLDDVRDAQENGENSAQVDGEKSAEVTGKD